jgi:septin family protein
MLHTLGPLNIGKSTNINTMFQTCESLKTIESMSFQSVTSATSFLISTEVIANFPHFNFISATSLDSAFESCDFTNTVQTPISISMNINTNCNDLFRAASRIKAIYITGSNNVTNWNEAFHSNSRLIKLEADMSGGTSFTSTFAGCDSLQDIDIPGIAHNVDFSDCHSMTKEVLDGLFESLATVSGKTIDVSGCLGASTCDTSIATNKGWTVTT